MKLINYEDFCRMPAGTVFAPYEPCCIERLEIKVDPGKEYEDHYGHTIYGFNGVMPLEPWIDGTTTLWEVGDEQEASFETYDGSNVDYDEKSLYLVFDNRDIDHMINALLWAKNGCKGDYDMGPDV